MLKRLVVAVVAIVAVGFLAKEGIGLWKEFKAARGEVELKNVKPAAPLEGSLETPHWPLAPSLTQEEQAAARRVLVMGKATIANAVFVDVTSFKIKPDKSQMMLTVVASNQHGEPVRLGDMFYAGYRVLNNSVFTSHPDYPERLISYNGLTFKTPENPVIASGERLEYTVYVVAPPPGMVEAIEGDGGLNVAIFYYYSPSGTRLRAFAAAPLKKDIAEMEAPKEIPSAPKTAEATPSPMTKEEKEQLNKLLATNTNTILHMVSVDVKKLVIKDDKTQLALTVAITNNYGEPIRLGDVVYDGYWVLNNTVLTRHPATYPERYISYDGLFFREQKIPVINPGENREYTFYIVYPPPGMIKTIEKDNGLMGGVFHFYSPQGMRLRAYVTAPIK